MAKYVNIAAMVLALLIIGGCGVSRVGNLVGLGGPDRTVYSGPVYPPTQEIAIAFQPAQVDRSCRVFAEVLMEVPAKRTGQEIAAAVEAEARMRGADGVLIGQSRQAADDNGLNFLYFGPSREYLCSDGCGGWKYGYQLWEEQGDWVPMGYAQWGNTETRFEAPLMTQLLLLRCQR